MKKTMMATTLVLSALCTQSALAVEYSEKTQYLGVVNGQVSGNSVVKVTRRRSWRCRRITGGMCRCRWKWRE